MRMVGVGRAALLGWATGTLLWGSPPATAASVAGRGAGAADLLVEYGITLALSGRVSAADSVFISVLSSSPGDPRALTNLGNLSLMRGDGELALAFYDRASRGDTADAGILLNRSVALLLEGDEVAARVEARRALARTREGPTARALLGLRETNRSPAPDKSSSQPVLTVEELRAFLAAAADSVPMDTVAAAHSPATPIQVRPTRARPPIWRSAGPRAAERTELGTLLYWKR